MKVGIIGSGGREHAICQSISNSNKIDEIFCFPGNAGTENIAKKANLWMYPPAIYSSPKKPEFLGLNAILDAQKAKSLPSSIPVEETGCLKPIVLKPKMY